MDKNRIKKTSAFYPGKGMECDICGICSFAHRHDKGALVKDFVVIDDANKPPSSLDEIYEEYSQSGFLDLADGLKESFKKDLASLFEVNFEKGYKKGKHSRCDMPQSACGQCYDEFLQFKKRKNEILFKM